MRRGIRGLKGIKVVTKPGGRQYKYRRVGGQLVPLPDLPENHPDFLAAYVAAGSVKPKPRFQTGTISALCATYLGSHDYRRLADSTRASLRWTLDRIMRDRGEGLVEDLRPDHLRKDIRALTPGASQGRLKAWRKILKFAVEEGMIPSDPTAGVRAQRGQTKPHRQWTAAELAKFREHWATTTSERIAFEVMYWTGARCVDAVGLGWQRVDDDGWLTFIQVKTGGPATCPIRTLPDWAEALTAEHAQFLASLPRDQMIWIVTRSGKPRSFKGLSRWISAAASAAGLPDDCTAHGLRKARAAALAMAGATTSQIGAWTGHVSLSEISHYTRQADQKGVLGAKQERKSGNSITKFPK